MELPQPAAITADLPGRTASQLAEARPQVSGIIRQRLFQEGGEVTAGTVLCQIDPAPYQAALDRRANSDTVKMKPSA